jgi:hypothetical protein
MVIDISPIVQALIGTAATVITLSAPVLAAYVIRRLHLESNAAAVAAVNSAAATGAGLAYSALVAESHMPASVEIKNATLAAGVSHVVESVPDAMKQAGVSEDTVARMVAGKLGELLSRDASVSAGPSASMPPPSVAAVPVAAIA